MIKFVGSFETVNSLPKTQFAEYAFIGRSNVGKSSLVNALSFHKGDAFFLNRNLTSIKNNL